MGMFDDLFSSSRGPGVIGTGLALVVLVGFGSLYMLVFDEEMQGGDKTIESIIRDQAGQIDSYEKSIAMQKDSIEKSKERVKLSDEVVGLERQIALRQTRIDEMKAEITEAGTAIEKVGTDWEAYKTLYRKAERGRAIGEEFPELTTKSGRSYKGVKINKIDDLRTGITHAQGGGSIAWNEMPDELADRFQFTKELADALYKKEHEVIDVLGDAADMTEIRSSIDIINSRIKESDALYNSKAQDNSQAHSRIQSLENKIQGLRNQIAAEANKQGLRQTPRYRSQIQECQNKIAAERGNISSFPAYQMEYRASRAKRLADVQELQKRLRDIELEAQKKPK
jgi:chromosome segregation ATPase